MCFMCASMLGFTKDINKKSDYPEMYGYRRQRSIKKYSYSVCLDTQIKIHSSFKNAIVIKRFVGIQYKSKYLFH